MVALKVGQARYINKELAIYKQIESSWRRKGRAHVVQRVDKLIDTNVDITRGCLVLEIMDFTAQDLFDRKGHSLGLAKGVVKQVAMGLEFIHSCGIVHGDTHPGNILVRLRPHQSTDARIHVTIKPTTTGSLDVKLSDLGAGKYYMA